MIIFSTQWNMHIHTIDGNYFIFWIRSKSNEFVGSTYTHAYLRICIAVTKQVQQVHTNKAHKERRSKMKMKKSKPIHFTSQNKLVRKKKKPPKIFDTWKKSVCNYTHTHTLHINAFLEYPGSEEFTEVQSLNLWEVQLAGRGHESALRVHKTPIIRKTGTASRLPTVLIQDVRKGTHTSPSPEKLLIYINTVKRGREGECLNAPTRDR